MLSDQRFDCFPLEQMNSSHPGERQSLAHLGTSVADLLTGPHPVKSHSFTHSFTHSYTDFIDKHFPSAGTLSYTQALRWHLGWTNTAMPNPEGAEGLVDWLCFLSSCKCSLPEVLLIWQPGENLDTQTEVTLREDLGSKWALTQHHCDLR